MTAIEGVCPILLVPFDDDGEIAYDDFRAQVRLLADGGCHAAILFGFASEFYKLSDAERRELIEVAVAEGDDAGIPIWASVTEGSTPVATEWARYFEDVGVDGLMLLPPFVGDADGDALREHVRAVGEAASVPILVQYAPGQTGSAISPGTFAALSEDVETIQSFKIECSPPGPYISDLLERADVDVLVGSAGRQLIEAMDRGAVGVIPGPALHELYLDVHENYVGGDRERAIALHNELLPMLNHIGQVGELFVHYEKTLMAERGVFGDDRCRAPTVSPDEHLDALVEDYYALLRDHLS